MSAEASHSTSTQIEKWCLPLFGGLVCASPQPSGAAQPGAARACDTGEGELSRLGTSSRVQSDRLGGSCSPSGRSRQEAKRAAACTGAKRAAMPGGIPATTDTVSSTSSRSLHGKRVRKNTHQRAELWAWRDRTGTGLR